MPQATAMGALTQCSFGLAPASLTVLPTSRVLVEGRPAATIMDSTPVNLPTFGMCSSLANPTVASATAAALGVLTPMPCVPALTPWSPGAPTTVLAGTPALGSGSTCQCAFGGVVTLLSTGAMKTTVA